MITEWDVAEWDRIKTDRAELNEMLVKADREQKERAAFWFKQGEVMGSTIWR